MNVSKRAVVTRAVLGHGKEDHVHVHSPVSGTDRITPALLRANAPIIYLHPRENHWPSTPAQYLAGSDLHAPDGSVVKSAPTPAEVYAYYAKLASDGLAGPANAAPTIQPRAEAVGAGLYSGNAPGKGLETTPAYAMVQEFPSRPNHIYLTYIYFYTYNGHYNILGGLFKAGAHPSDIEHFTVELDRTTLTPTRYYYGAHGNTDGSWIPAKDIPTERVNSVARDGSNKVTARPIAYAAYHGHGLYSTKGHVWRIYGFANDLTGKGARWDPPLIRIYPEDDDRFDPGTMGWAYYGGNWEPTGINGVVRKDWFREFISHTLNPRVFNSLGFYAVVVLIIVLVVAALVGTGALVGLGISKLMEESDPGVGAPSQAKN